MGPSPFLDIMDRLRAGDEAAAREVYARSAGRLIGLARRKLGGVPAGKEDPEDVVQSVYRSFFRRYGDGAFRVEDWSDVWALLATIAARKCANRRSRYRADRRDAGREVALIEGEVSGSEPDPEEAAVLVETVERLLRGLDPGQRAIVELSLQGYTTREIGDQLGRAERSVQRVREHVRERLLARGNE